MILSLAGCTTFTINYMTNRGYLKPAPSPEQLKEMYDDKRSEMKEKTDEMSRKLMEKREEMKEKTDEMSRKLMEKREEMKEKTDEMSRKLMEKREEMGRRGIEIRDKLEKGKDNLLERFEDQRNEMTRQLEDRRNELKERLSAPSLIKETCDDKKDVHESINKIDTFTEKLTTHNELQSNNEKRTKEFHEKLEKSKDIVNNNLSNEDDIPKLRK